MSASVYELAEEIKRKGHESPSELAHLLKRAEDLAADESRDRLTRALAYRAAGNAHQLLNNFPSALEQYDHATSILESAGERVELGRTLLAKVGVLFYLTRFEELFECARTARALFQELGDEARLARVDVNLGNAYHRLDRYREALECYGLAFPVLERVSDLEGLLATSMNAAVAYTALHEFERAEQLYEKALALAKDLNKPTLMLGCRYNITYLRYLRGSSGEALSGLVSLRQEFEATKNDHLVCLCWLDEAEILLEVGDLEEAIHCAKVARMMSQRLGLNYEAGKSLLFESAATLRLGRNAGVEGLLEEAIRRFEGEGNNVWRAVARLQAALFRGERGDPDALGEATAARDLLPRHDLPHRRALADIVIGRIQRACGDDSGAIDSFKSAVKFAQQGRSEWMEFHACYELGVSLSGKDDPTGGLFLRRAESMLDSLWNRLGSDDLKIAFLADRENVYTHLVRSTVSQSPSKLSSCQKRPGLVYFWNGC